MKKKLILLYLLLSLASLEAEQHVSQVDQKVIDVMGLSIKSDLSILGSDRDAVIARLREVATGQINHIGIVSASQDNAQIVLMRLGDDQTIQQVVAQYDQYNSRYVVAHIPDILEWSHQPAAIPYLASDFFLDEDPSKSVNLQENWEAVGVPMRSIYSGVIALEIIKRAPEFSEQMKDWAKEALAFWPKDPAKFRRLMQAWWNKNKDAFAQKNYSDVQPIDLNSFEASSPAAIQPSPPPPPQEIKTSIKPPELVAQISPVPAPPVQPSNATSIPIWIYGIIVASLCLIAGLCYFLRARK